MTQISSVDSLRQFITRTNLRNLNASDAEDYARGWTYRNYFEKLEDLIDRAHILTVHTIYEECKIR
jgi:hypothetical protein